MKGGPTSSHRFLLVMKASPCRGTRWRSVPGIYSGGSPWWTCGEQAAQSVGDRPMHEVMTPRERA
jgi:hypothetical protein